MEKHNDFLLWTTEFKGNIFVYLNINLFKQDITIKVLKFRCQFLTELWKGVNMDL